MRTSWTLFFVFLFIFWQLWNKLVPLTQIATFIGTAWISATLSYRLSRFVWHKAFVTRVHGGGKAVLITGCDTGFGHRLAKRLAREGFLVFAGCLSSSSYGAKELKTLSNMRVLQLDVTKQDEVNAALETVKKNLGTTVLWSVVANAGIAHLGLLEWVTTDTVIKTFDVNVFGVLRVIKSFLPLLKKTKGRVVTVASPLGRFTMPMVAPYCMSKHAVVSMMDAFRRECSGRGVDFITVEPGFHRTPMIRKCSTSIELILKEFEQQSPDVIADYSHDDIEELVKASIKSFEACMRENPEEAVDVLENAARETYPMTAYTSSLSLDVAYQTFITSVSSELADIVISMTRNLSVWLKKPLK